MRLCSSSAASYSRLTRISRWANGLATAGASFIESPCNGLCRTKGSAAPSLLLMGKSRLRRLFGHRLRFRRQKARLLPPAQQRGGSVGHVFTRLAEEDPRPALDRQLQIHARGREVHERAGVIECQVVVRARAKLLEPGRIVGVDPAC